MSHATDARAVPTVLHGKFSTWLPWHQPFLRDLMAGLDGSFRNVVLCNRVANEERFGRPDVVCVKSRALLQPAAAALCAVDLRARYAPALLHGHFGWSGARLLLLKAALRRPLVTTFGGRDAGVQLRAEGSAPLYALLLEACDVIVCVSSHLRDQVVDAGADASRVRVVHRGTDLDRFARVERAQRAPGPLRLLMVGRLVAKKGHGDALAALRRLLDAGCPARLDVVGEGPARAEIEAQRASLGLGDAVAIHAPTDQQGLCARLAGADVFLHCSVTAADGDVEGIPNVVVEAAATGLPVVATRHGGLVEAVADGETGVLVPEGDPEALAAALERLAAEPARRLALGRAGAARARRAFDLRAQVAAHEALYRELLVGAPPRPVPLPDGFAAAARRALGSSGRGLDLAQARAVAAALGAAPLAPHLAAAPRGPLDRALEAPTGWPRPWRSAAELSLDLAGRVLPGALRGFHARSRARAASLDLAVLAHLRAGAPLHDPPPALLAAPLHDLRGEPPPDTPWRRLRTRLSAPSPDPTEGF